MMAGLFGGPKLEKPPELSDEEVEEERRRRLRRDSNGPKGGTVLTGGAGLNQPILGTAASLQGASL